MKNRFCLWLLLAALPLLAEAQIVEPVKFSAQLRTAATAEADIVFSATIDEGWHVYSTHLGQDGPIEATFHTVLHDGIELVGDLMAHGDEQAVYDDLFGMTLRYFEGQVQFVQHVRFTAARYALDCYLTYGACNASSCLPPTDVPLRAEGAAPAFVGQKEESDNSVAADITAAIDDGSNNATQAADSISTTSSYDMAALGDARLWQPVVDILQEQEGNSGTAHTPLWYIFLMGLVGGFIALLTPCVWPIIPMTVSFFLKKAKDNTAQGLRDALTYGASIVVIYLALGLLITVLFGASALNALSTSAVFNLFFFVLLVVFALSFFGMFELRLPERWGNAVDSKAATTTGLLSIFLMAFTLTLVSFSCTGPIIGFLLVEVSTTGSMLGPAIGMLGFAVALALPFTLFALFPSWLHRAPRSGAWMTTIKVVLGFIELAFALKFLSVADLAYGWHILDREVFLALWIVIFGLLGLYLIGILKFQVDTIGGEKEKPQPVASIMLGLLSLAFAVYMVPGLWGAPCKAVSAFAPPMTTQDFSLNARDEVRAAYTSYDEGMAAAAAQGKPAFVDFTGFGCVNCRKMEAAVWTDPQVADVLRDDYVLISLFVDDKTPLPQPIAVAEHGQQRTLRTVGDKWSYLQRHKFGANAQPFYVALDNDGQPLDGTFVYKEDVAAFRAFLSDGLREYKRRAKE